MSKEEENLFVLSRAQRIVLQARRKKKWSESKKMKRIGRRRQHRKILKSETRAQTKLDMRWHYNNLIRICIVFGHRSCAMCV